MLLRLPLETDDEPRLLDAVSGMIALLAEHGAPDVVHVVRIRGSFDQKWLRYSGIGRVPFAGGSLIHTALDAFWQGNLTLPPFPPGRVIRQMSFQRESHRRYLLLEHAPAIHQVVRSSSAANLFRRLSRSHPESLFVWLSTGSIGGWASLMTYETFGSLHRAWFASLRLTEVGWSVHRSKAIDRAALANRLPGFSAASLDRAG